MKIYHGTNVDFDTINLEKSNKYKDFGQGFYLTDIRSQAEQLAAKKAKLFGGYPIFRNMNSTKNSSTMESLMFLSLKIHVKNGPSLYSRTAIEI